MSGFDDLTVLVLAGGRGTRLQGLHPETPKPMIPIAGQPFLHWLTLWVAGHGPHDFVFSTGHLAASVDDWARRSDRPALSCRCSREFSPLGTGGAVLHALPICREWILVLNGDSLILRGLDELLALRAEPDHDGGLIGLEVEDTARYGSLILKDGGWLAGFHEKIPGRGLINGGVYLLRRDGLRGLGNKGACSIEYDVFPALIAQGARLRVVPVNGAPFIDIGTPESLAQADAFVRQHFLSEEA